MIVVSPGGLLIVQPSYIEGREEARERAVRLGQILVIIHINNIRSCIIVLIILSYTLV